MRKTVYSLVLTPEIVEAVDRLAYVRGMSRSNLIDNILAEAVGYVTPEQRVQQMFDTLSHAIGSEFHRQEQAAGDLMVLRRQLRYRYKPTVRYRVELFQRDEESCAVVTASFRTQSAELLYEVNEFFRIYTITELTYGWCRSGDIVHKDGKWSKRYYPTGEQLRHPQELGNALAAYIRRFDTLLQQYFAALPDRKQALTVVTEAFQRESTE